MRKAWLAVFLLAGPAAGQDPDANDRLNRDLIRAETDKKIAAAVAKLREELKLPPAAPTKPQTATVQVGDWLVTSSVNAKGELRVVVEPAVPLPPGPIPPIPPDPIPPTPDPPKPAVKPWGIVVVEETADAVATRGAFFASPQLSKYLTDHGLKFRAVDKDVVGPDGKPPADVARFLADAKARKLPMAYLVDVKGGLIAGVPLSADSTPADVIKILEGGGK